MFQLQNQMEPSLCEKTREPFGKLFINTIIDTFVHSFSIYGMIIIGAFLVVGTIPELLPVTIAWMVGFCLAVLYFSGKKRGEKFFRLIITYERNLVSWLEPQAYEP